MQLKCSLFSCMKTKKPSSQSSVDISNSSTSLSNDRVGLNLEVFTFKEIQKITQGFSKNNFLGKGGFGKVYKGFIDDEFRIGLRSQPVAVKSLDLSSKQGHREWLTEVIFLGVLKHPNLVNLIGYCCEDEQRVLVYEYMTRGTLEDNLFNYDTATLPWLTRLKIAVDAAKGLAFLHGEKKPVIYRDFKAANILLDSDFTAKLSDFGLAIDGPEEDETYVTPEHVMGTRGYAAPEYIMTGQATTMNDVYSFGVVMLELISGRKCLDKSLRKKEQSIVDWAKPFLRDISNEVDYLVDLRLHDQYSVVGAQRAAMLAHQCVNPGPKSRPTMTKVVKILESLLDLN